MWKEDQEQQKPVCVMFDFLNINAINSADGRLTELQLPLYTYLCLRGKQTNGGGSGWSIEGHKKFDEFMALKADRKQNAKHFNPQLLLLFKLVAVANNLLNTTQRTMHAQSQSGISLHK
jgi:hypothetical protein